MTSISPSRNLEFAIGHIEHSVVRAVGSLPLAQPRALEVAA
jgi:hypothetical protein